MNSEKPKETDNEFFSIENANMSKSVILPNDQFDKRELEDEHGIERPFTNSDNSIQMGNEGEKEVKAKDVEPKIVDLEQCTNCGRKFFLGRLMLHQKNCTAEHPFKTKHGEGDPKAKTVQAEIVVKTPKRKKKLRS